MTKRRKRRPNKNKIERNRKKENDILSVKNDEPDIYDESEELLEFINRLEAREKSISEAEKSEDITECVENQEELPEFNESSDDMTDNPGFSDSSDSMKAESGFTESSVSGEDELGSSGESNDIKAGPGFTDSSDSREAELGSSDEFDNTVAGPGFTDSSDDTEDEPEFTDIPNNQEQSSENPEPAEMSKSSTKKAAAGTSEASSVEREQSGEQRKTGQQSSGQHIGGKQTGQQSSGQHIGGKRTTGQQNSGKQRTGQQSRRRRGKRRAVRRKETAFQRNFQRIGGVAAFVLLIISTVFTVQGVMAGKTRSSEMEKAQDNAVAAITAAVTPTQDPTMRPRALPIPENVPEQDAQGFFANGISTVDGQSVTILCGGDNLIHESIYERARTENGFNFDYLYENVKSFIQSADIATINQEAPLATDISEPSGYPLFNTPKEVGQSLFDAGFDVINIGNNHIFDQGNEGAMATETYFRNRGIPVVGLYKNDEDCHFLRIIEHNGIKVAFLSFVEMTNLDGDKDEEGFVIYMDNRTAVKEQIEEAREQADIIVVHAHWGEEGTTELTDGQVEMARLMVDWGADIIFGNHPHVIQKLTLLTRESDSQLCPVIYSMGNFVSAQTHRNQLVSAMLAVRVARDANGIVRPQAMGVMPVVTHFVQEDRSDVILYPLAAYSEELAESHDVNREDGDFSIDYINGLIAEQIPDRYLHRMSSLT